MKEITYHVGKDYPNLVNRKEISDGRDKIGGAIRARSLGQANVDVEFNSDSLIPIFRGIIVGVDKISF